MIRRFLDRMYRASGLAGAFMLVAISFMVIAQMIARWLEAPATGLTEIAGYCMAATSFFGLGYAFSCDSHIRVNLIVGRGESGQRFAEIICTSISAGIAGALTFFAIKATIVSFRFNEVSQGQDQIQIWIPQTVMSVGSVVLFVAIVDRLAGIVWPSDQAVNCIDG